jgi:hypothetical protein
VTRPEISVVVSTRNRAGTMPDSLRAIERLACDVPWELVVVDNGSTDGTPRVIEQFARSTRIAFRSVSEPRPGLSRARNAGWRAASGALIAFTDDDCYPQPDYLTELLRCFAAGDVGYVGGRILLYDADDHPITVQLSERRTRIEPGSHVSAGTIQGANMAARRVVLEAVGGFDDLLGAGTPYACEDVDFVSRASAAGFTGVYDPGPVVLHHHRRRTAQDVRALRRTYDLGRGAYLAKCLLDPRRRGPALRALLRGLRGNLASGWRSRRGIERIAGEWQGACRYLTDRGRLAS